MDKVGFVVALLGLGGLAESYDDPKAMVISIALIVIGSGLMYVGLKNEKSNNRRSDSNVLDRLYFLR